MNEIQKIVPSLWFDMDCEEAVNYYIDTFNSSPHKAGNSRIISLARYEDSMQTPGIEQMVGKVLTAIFELNGQKFMALDGGPIFKFNESISFYVECEDQAEVDRLWSALTADGGEESQCGWLKDRFGLSWQVIPERMGELLSDPDPDRAGRAMQAMLKMQKIDIQALEDAANGA